jgi:hypothetical protein
MAVTTDRGQATGRRRFFSDAFRKEVTPKSMTLDAIVAGLLPGIRRCWRRSTMFRSDTSKEVCGA